jgi:hypothetical protein
LRNELSKDENTYSESVAFADPSNPNKNYSYRKAERYDNPALSHYLFRSFAV